jgi:hypothetical protein
MASLAGYALSAAPSASTLGLTLSIHSSAMTSVLEVSVGQCNYLQVLSGTAKHYDAQDSSKGTTSTMLYQTYSATT